MAGQVRGPIIMAALGRNDDLHGGIIEARLDNRPRFFGRLCQEGLPQNDIRQARLDLFQTLCLMFEAGPYLSEKVFWRNESDFRRG